MPSHATTLEGIQESPIEATWARFDGSSNHEQFKPICTSVSDQSIWNNDCANAFTTHSSEILFPEPDFGDSWDEFSATDASSPMSFASETLLNVQDFECNSVITVVSEVIDEIIATVVKMSTRNISKTLSLSLAEEVNEYLQCVNITTNCKGEETGNKDVAREGIKHNSATGTSLNDVAIGSMVVHLKTSRCGVVTSCVGTEELTLCLASGHEVHTTMSRVSRLDPTNVVKVLELQSAHTGDYVYTARKLLSLCSSNVPGFDRKEALETAVEVVLSAPLTPELSQLDTIALEGITEEVFLACAAHYLEANGVDEAVDQLQKLLQQRPNCPRGQAMLRAMIDTDESPSNVKQCNMSTFSSEGDESVCNGPTFSDDDSSPVHFSGPRRSFDETELYRAPGCTTKLLEKMRSRGDNHNDRGNTRLSRRRRRSSLSFSFRKSRSRSRSTSHQSYTTTNGSQSSLESMDPVPETDSSEAMPSIRTEPITHMEVQIGGQAECPNGLDEVNGLPSFLSDHQCQQLQETAPETQSSPQPVRVQSVPLPAAPRAPVTSLFSTPPRPRPGSSTQYQSAPAVSSESRSRRPRLRRTSAPPERESAARLPNPAEQVRRMRRRGSDPGQRTWNAAWIPRQGKKLVAAASRRIGPRSRGGSTSSVM